MLALVRAAVVVVFVVLPVGVASAQAMTGAEIKAALEGSTISNENEFQFFKPDGVAIYRKGNAKVTGRWGVEGDKFCFDLNIDARYPAPGADMITEWECYSVTGDEKRVSFIINQHASPWVISEGNKVD